MGVILSATKQGEGQDQWTSVDGGQGSSRNKQEAVQKKSFTLDKKTMMPSGGNGAKRIKGWANVEALLRK